MNKRVCVAHDQSHVSIMVKETFSDGTYGLRPIEGGNFDLAEAVELASDILSSAGEMLKMQASSLRTTSVKERRRAEKSRKAHQ